MEDEIDFASLHHFSIFLRTKHAAEARGETYTAEDYRNTVMAQIAEANAGSEEAALKQVEKRVVKTAPVADEAIDTTTEEARLKAAEEWAKGSQA